MLKTKFLILLPLCLIVFLSTAVYWWVCNTSGDIVLCDNVTTYIDTQWNEFQMWTITFSDWTNEITILDRNLWAKSNDITSEDSKWYYFQWWNNNWFKNIWDLETSSKAVNTRWYARNNPYVSETYIVSNMNRSSIDNRDLWWWWEDNADNYYWMDANNWYMRQWPCPAWYHVPSEWEINRLFTLWYNKVKGGDKDIHNVNIFRMDEAVDMINAFRFPPSWERRYIDASLNLLWGRSYLWTSTPWNIDREDLRKSAYVVEWDSYAISSQWLNDRGWWVNVRCFKDEYKWSIKIITLSYETNWWPKVQSQTLLRWSTWYLPWYQIQRLWYRLEWWYFDKSFKQPFDADEILKEDTTLYAKWGKVENLPYVKGSLVGNVWVTWTWDEFQVAYEFAYKNGITTQKNIRDANMSGKMTRIAMAKMLSQYAINVLWREPNLQKNCSFSDVTVWLDNQFGNWVTLACQLWIMGVWMNEFRPNDSVTRAEFGAALSRMIYWISDGSIHYYSTHLLKLYNEWIITNMDPKIKELRWYVMIMLMRAAEKNVWTSESKNNNDNYQNVDKKDMQVDKDWEGFVKLTDAEIKDYYYNNCVCPKWYSYTPEWVTYGDPWCEVEICENDSSKCVLNVTSFNNTCRVKPDIEKVSSWISMGRKDVENYYKKNCSCPIWFKFVPKQLDTYADSCDREYCLDAKCKEVKIWHIWVKDLCSKS